MDTIADFNATDNTIQLENAIFAGLGAKTGWLSADKFTIGIEASEASRRIIFDYATGALFYDADGAGDGTSIRFAVIVLDGLTGPLTATDFLLI